MVHYVSLKYLRILAVMAESSSSAMSIMNMRVGSSCMNVGQMGFLTMEII